MKMCLASAFYLAVLNITNWIKWREPIANWSAYSKNTLGYSTTPETLLKAFSRNSMAINTSSGTSKGAFSSKEKRPCTIAQSLEKGGYNLGIFSMTLLQSFYTLTK